MRPVAPPPIQAQMPTVPAAAAGAADGAAWPNCASNCAAAPIAGCGGGRTPAPAEAVAALPEHIHHGTSNGYPAVNGYAAPPPPHAALPQAPHAAPPLDPDDGDFDEPESGPLRDRLIWAMERTGWVQAKAARLLGMTTRQVSYALRKYNVEIKRF